MVLLGCSAAVNTEVHVCGFLYILYPHGADQTIAGPGNLSLSSIICHVMSSFINIVITGQLTMALMLMPPIMSLSLTAAGGGLLRLLWSWL